MAEELTATVAGGMVYLGSASGSVSWCTTNFMACSTSLWAGSINPTAMTSDDSGVYWGTSAGAEGSMVYALAPLTGSAVALATELDAGISGIATDAIYVYFVGGGSIWRIAKLADAGTTPDLVGYDYINLRAVVPLASALYFTDESGSVNLLPVEDGGYGTFNTFAGGFHWAPVGLAVDAQRLYWANYTPDSGILACAPNPAGCAGEPAVVAAMPYTEWVLVDDASVYFTTRVPDPGMLDDNNGAFYQVVK
jgi:hypothetical protein